MDIFILILVGLCLWSSKITFEFHKDYISRNQTDSLKGIFAILILFSHIRGYIPPLIGGGSTLYTSILGFLNQLIVVIFLFYSGYGILESLKRDRVKYSNTFLTHRVLKIWLMFVLAVAIYFILSLLLGHRYSTNEYLLSLIGWTSIGNSNWFVFDILILYLITYFSLQITARLNYSNLQLLVIIIYILTFVFIFSLIFGGKQLWWIDTVIAYPTGMLYSIYKERFEKWICIGKRWEYTFILTTITFIIIYSIINPALTKVFPHVSTMMKLLLNVLRLFLIVTVTSIFAFDLVLLTMKFKLDNSILRWLGINSFSIYILQRIAMIICSHFKLNDNAILFSCLVIPTTLLLASFFTVFTSNLNKRIFK